MKHPYVFLWFLAAFLLQSSLVLNFGFMGLAPNFILCVTIIFSFYHEGNITLVLALIFGLFLDVNFSVLTGPSALALVLIVWGTNPLKTFFYKESIFNLMLISLLGNLFYYGFTWFLIKIFKGIYTFTYMAKNLPILLVMNTGVILVLYFVLARRLIASERKTFL